jgi:uncharacterized RDD family membrane protein YckC
MTRPAAVAALHADEGKRVREIVTPEGVPLRFTLAGAGDRAGAFLIDVVILFAGLIAIGLVAESATGGHASWLRALIVVVSFLGFNFYFAVFEVRWRGATPGKRALGIRVIDARGGQLETSAVLARNLVRELEAWIPLRLLLAGGLVWPEAPGWARLIAFCWAFVFLLMPLFNKDRLRVGDLIAGTRVVLQPKVVLAPDLVAEAAVALKQNFPRAAPAAYAFTEAQLSIYGIYELQVLENVLRGNPALASHHEAVRTVSEKVRGKIRYDAVSVDDDRFLRDFYAAQRAHLEQKLLFGQRRQDKYARK